jgi:hypothetical protein
LGPSFITIVRRKALKAPQRAKRQGSSTKTNHVIRSTQVCNVPSPSNEQKIIPSDPVAQPFWNSDGAYMITNADLWRCASDSERGACL